jgi:adenylate kinase
MLRAAVEEGSSLGLEAKMYMDSGQLLPDETMIGIILARLQEKDCVERGWLLDGFPRTPEQAKALEKAGIECDTFIHLDVPDNILTERVVGRRSDPVTGKIYHMTFSPPENEEIASRLIQRSDDTEEKIIVRINAFNRNLSSILEFYQSKMIKLDGNRSAKLIWSDILAAFKNNDLKIEKLACLKNQPRIIICGAPASGKGTQCELIRYLFVCIFLILFPG